MSKTHAAVPKLFVYGAGRIQSTSPGVAWQEELPAGSSLDRIAILGLIPVQRQNAALRALAHPFDLFLDAFIPGSGGSSAASRVWYEAASEVPRIVAKSTEVGLDIADAVAEIRVALSLQVKELARVVRVERPTVYAWLRGEARPQPANRNRIAELLDIARRWNAMSNRPLGAPVRGAMNSRGQTLVDLLAETRPNQEAIEDLMQQVAIQITENKGKRKGIREIAQRHGIDVRRVRQSDAEFDVLTGKRSHED